MEADYKFINSFKILDRKRENKHTYYRVQCPVCNNIKWMRADGLKHAKSCGCLGKAAQFKAEDIKGQKFGRLTALEPTDKRKDNGSVIWRCRCECGNIAYKPISWLKKGGVKSCGCLSKEIHAAAGRGTLTQKAKKVCVEGTRLDNLTAKKPKNNKSGIKGVTWDVNRHKWKAQIGFKGKMYYLGRYATKEEAAKARKKAEGQLFKPILDKYS